MILVLFTQADLGHHLLSCIFYFIHRFNDFYLLLAEKMFLWYICNWLFKASELKELQCNLVPDLFVLKWILCFVYRWRPNFLDLSFGVYLVIISERGWQPFSLQPLCPLCLCTTMASTASSTSIWTSSGRSKSESTQQLDCLGWVQILKHWAFGLSWLGPNLKALSILDFFR